MDLEDDLDSKPVQKTTGNNEIPRCHFCMIENLYLMGSAIIQSALK